MQVILSHPRELARAIYLLESAPLDGTKVMELAEYVEDRSLAQNRLAFRWYNDAADQLKDGTASDKRAYCKLHFGVAILKDGTGKAADKFRDVYDRIIRPLTYEQKLELMTEPINLPITSLMTVKQFTQYLDAVQHFFSSIGVVLITDDDLFNTAMGRKKEKANG